MLYMEKLVIYSSLWGNLYRHRYYINGLRVTESVFSDKLKSLKESTYIRTHESGSSWCRITYTGINPKGPTQL